MSNKAYGKCAGRQKAVNGEAKSCRCRQFDPKEDDEKGCDCCSHHRSFHVPKHFDYSAYKLCSMDDNDMDGEPCPCQEFDPPAEGKSCGACGHHRRNHDLPSSPVLNPTSQPSLPFSLSVSQQVAGNKRPLMSSDFGFAPGIASPTSFKDSEDSEGKRAKRMQVDMAEAGRVKKGGDLGSDKGESKKPAFYDFSGDDWREDFEDHGDDKSPGIAPENESEPCTMEKPSPKLPSLPRECYQKWLSKIKDDSDLKQVTQGIAFEFVNDGGDWSVFCPPCKGNRVGGKTKVGGGTTLKNFQKHLQSTGHKTNLELMEKQQATHAKRALTRERANVPRSSTRLERLPRTG